MRTDSGKVLIVTGAARGIGAAVARLAARDGYRVVVNYSASRQAAETLAGEIGAAGGSAVALAGDVAKEADVLRLFAETDKRFGRLDGLVNNAGITRDALLVKVKDGEVIGKMSLAQWQAVIDVNLTGVFLCAREAAERMIRRGNGGVIVNISSISRAGNLGQTNYSAAKAGVVAMTVAWGKELARYHIRVGAVAPGFIRTPMVAAMKPEALAKVTAPVPLGRLGEPEEIAAAVDFIFRNEFFTGRCLELDGGLRL